jgi:hypothetical protein
LISVTTRSDEDFTNGFMVNLLIVMEEPLVMAALPWAPSSSSPF